jgi:hypothetical protein
MIQATLPDALYEGVFAFTETKKLYPRPVWVYKKVPGANSRMTESEELLKVHYPQLYREWKTFREEQPTYQFPTD